jgi:hypothetical protein
MSREILRTYLWLQNPEDHIRAPLTDKRARIEKVQNCPASFYRYLYTEVGGAYHWVDRLSWSDEEIRKHLLTQDVQLWVFYCEGAPAGYFQLQRHEDATIEIA